MHGEIIAESPHESAADSTDVFGFWIYIMTDCILFGCLFATFIVLNYQAMQPSPLKSYLNLNTVLIETFLLLISNFTFGIAILNLYLLRIFRVQLWLFVTIIFGVSFVVLEVLEFIHLAHEGFRWDVSSHASSFFTLVGTHGLHVSCGLIWITIMIIQLPLLKASVAKRRMTYLGLFWNFLDIVWIFVFTIVYLMGAI